MLLRKVQSLFKTFTFEELSLSFENDEFPTELPEDQAALQRRPTGLLKRNTSKTNLYSREVRSAFGWTDASSEPLNFSEEQQWKDQKTFSKQDLLPRLPVPDLKMTCAKYLATVEPLVTPEEFERTKSAVQEFLQAGGPGEKLQKLLLERQDSSVPSWLEEWWDDSYLCMRESIAVNVNYFFVFKDDPKLANNTQLHRACTLLRGALLFKAQLDSGAIEPDQERGTPLDMSQYPRLFGQCRIPGEKRDKIITYTKYRPAGRSATSKTTEYVDAEPTHVVVMYRNQMYWFDAIIDGQVAPLSKIYSNLAEIVQQAHISDEREPPVGLLTAWTRTEWAQVRTRLWELSELNRQTLLKIQSALLVVCLDTAAPSTLDEMSRIPLHGPCANRWFDKHQLIVCANGKAAMIFEHTVADGSTTLGLADAMFQYSIEPGKVMQAHAATPNKLAWHLDEEVEDAIVSAYEFFREQILENETQTLEFKHFGGNFIKGENLSPDAFVQLAMQLTYFKMFGRCDATYESASTRQFLHGRTETVRSATREAVAFVGATRQPIVAADAQMPAQLVRLREACNAHVKYMRDAKDGRGVDRHLFGLRMIYESQHASLDFEKPAIFQDPAYRKSSHWNLSTSHCGSATLALFGFGPVVPDGFGIGYMIKNNEIDFNVTAKYPNGCTSSAIFVALLELSLLEMRAVLLSDPKYLVRRPSRSLDFTHPTSSAEIKPYSPASSPFVGRPIRRSGSPGNVDGNGTASLRGTA
eukprot:TRINITY_DN27609_c0_g1_i1.p1 TRINITY_DN27609_c0_g1~~TRINITY_DN27609_c0_g1_i1.p1  ORF type:complete len:752 (-),score=261.05 TRINITY_DN27609_c0_g1_i1:208-2463(-)